jgi:hypothetical protein
MWILPIATARARRFLPLALALATSTVGCSLPQFHAEEVIQTQSCIAGARSMQLTFDVVPSLIAVDWVGGSSNIIGDPVIFGPPGVVVIAALDNVGLGDEVTLRFDTVGGPGMFVQVLDVQFYPVPPDSIPPAPGCDPTSSPQFRVDNDASVALALHVSNATSQPMSVQRLELTTSPSVLSPTALVWGDPAFEALPWHAALPADTELDPLAPPTLIDLPEDAGGANAALCRFESSSRGRTMRGIFQVDLTGLPVGAKPADWGAVKARYRR